MRRPAIRFLHAAAMIIPTLSIGCAGGSAPTPPPTPAPNSPVVSVAPPVKSDTPATATEQPAANPAVRGSTKPATAAEVAAVLDVRAFPKLPGATREMTQISPLGDVAYHAPGTATAASDFYLKAFADAGWTEHFTGDKRAVVKEAGGEYVTLWFTKRGFVVTVSLSSSPGNPEVMTTVINMGNFDARSLPRMKDGTLLGASDTFPNYPTAISTTSAPVADVVAFTRKELVALGWQEYTSNLRDEAAPDPRSTLFRNKAVRLYVTVTATPGAGGKTMVQYSTGVLALDAPTPADATDVRLTEGGVHQLRFDTALDTAAITAFYQTALPPLGWTFRAGDRPTQFSFVAANKNVLAVSLKPLADHKTQVQMVRLVPPKAENGGKNTKPAK